MGYRLFEDTKINNVLENVKKNIKKERQEKMNYEYFQLDILDENKKVKKSSKFKKLDKVMERYSDELKVHSPQNLRIKAYYPAFGFINFIHIKNLKENYEKNKNMDNRILYYTVSNFKDGKFVDKKYKDFAEAYVMFNENNEKIVKLSFCLSNFGIVEVAKKTNKEN